MVWRKSPPGVSAPYEVVLEFSCFLQDFCSFQVVLAVWEEIGSGFILLESLDLCQKEAPPQWEMGFVLSSQMLTFPCLWTLKISSTLCFLLQTSFGSSKSLIFAALECYSCMEKDNRGHPAGVDG